MKSDTDLKGDKPLATSVALTPNMEFSRLASDERIERTVQALEANNIQAFVAATGDEARQRVIDLLPEGAEVYTGGSRTLEAIGLTAEIDASPRFQAVRPRLLAMDRQTQGREMRKLGASPDVVVGSVHAVTEHGQLMIASAGGSQLAPYAYGAGTVIWVVGTQKLVRDLDEGLARIEQYSYPLEDARLRETYGRPSAVAKILIVNREYIPGRATVVLVKENLGF
jgi:hypothetical protein